MEEHLSVPDSPEVTPTQSFNAADGTVRNKKGQFVKGHASTYQKGKARGPKPGTFKKQVKEHLHGLLNEPDVRKQWRKILRDPSHPQYARILDIALKYGIGLPKQEIEHSGLPDPIVFVLPRNGREAEPDQVYQDGEMEVLEVEAEPLQLESGESTDGNETQD